MLNFTHTTLGQRVLFGSGIAADHLVDEVERLRSKSVMMITDGQQQQLARELAHQISKAFVYDGVAPHVPIEAAEAARTLAASHDVDLLVSVGGGSATGLAKAVALTSGIPVVAIPTTYAGSEATNVWGITERSNKTTGIDDRVLPVSVIYDVELTYTLPTDLSVASGLNALAHCVDSMWAPRVDPINQAIASEGIRALAAGLPEVHRAAQEAGGREQVLYGAYLSAVAFASAGSGMHHKICHVLGGAYDLPHAQTHAIVLPHVLAYLAPAAPTAADRIADAFGTQDALSGLLALRETIDAPRALRDYGFDESVIEDAARLILPAIPPSTPRPVTIGDLSGLLHDAWAGAVPTTEMSKK